MQLLRWTSRSLRNLVKDLAKKGHQVSRTVVGDLLRELGYSLQANAKTREGSAHIDRDAQFEYINTQATAFLRTGDPVISDDTKKKELVGNYKNNGRVWRPKGEPVEVNVHDFIDPALPRAVPYGVYDLTNNIGWVSVGTDRDTASFAVNAIRRWWTAMGKERNPKASRVMITADGAAAMATACGYGRWNCRSWPTSSDFQLLFVICRREPASGTKSSIASFRSSALIGGVSRCSPIARSFS